MRRAGAAATANQTRTSSIPTRNIEVPVEIAGLARPGVARRVEGLARVRVDNNAFSRRGGADRFDERPRVLWRRAVDPDGEYAVVEHRDNVLQCRTVTQTLAIPAGKAHPRRCRTAGQQFAQDPRFTSIGNGLDRQNIGARPIEYGEPLGMKTPQLIIAGVVDARVFGPVVQNGAERPDTGGDQHGT